MKNVKAKKEYGQNFLKDSQILNKIIESMPHNKNHIVEIGPGLGDLTKHLVKYKDVTAYEVDTDLIGILKSKFADELSCKKLVLNHIDVLKYWEEEGSLYNNKYDLIANLPYYIATSIILRAFEDSFCEHIIVMVQKEVALKFTANVNEKEYSSLSIITELISLDSKILFDVPPTAFDPAPKVTSSVLFIKKDLTKIVDKGFNSFLKACFIQPRKKLSKNLTSILDNSSIDEIFNSLQIDSNKRPHEVSSSLYNQIYTKVKNGRDK